MFNFAKKDFNIVKKFPTLILISLMIVVCGAIFMLGHGLNLGIDYAGGAKVEIELAEEIADKDAFEAHLRELITDGGYTVVDKMMESPLAEGGITYEFRLAYEYHGSIVADDAQDAFITKLNGDFKTTLTEDVEAYLAGLGLEDMFEEDGVNVAVIGASSSKALLNRTFIAIALALVAILVYIMIRFTVSSGLAAICGLTHDVLVMVALTAIFQIPVNMTFIAAVITIIGYSINASIVIFDKVRECQNSAAFAYASDEEIANYAIKHSMVKILLSILTTLIMVVALVLFSVSTIQEFILPIIFGLLAGTVSALCLAPSIWVLFRKLGAKIKSKKA